MIYLPGESKLVSFSVFAWLSNHDLMDTFNILINLFITVLSKNTEKKLITLLRLKFGSKSNYGGFLFLRSNKNILDPNTSLKLKVFGSLYRTRETSDIE